MVLIYEFSTFKKTPNNVFSLNYVMIMMKIKSCILNRPCWIRSFEF